MNKQKVSNSMVWAERIKLLIPHFWISVSVSWNVYVLTLRKLLIQLTSLPHDSNFFEVVISQKERAATERIKCSFHDGNNVSKTHLTPTRNSKYLCIPWRHYSLLHSFFASESSRLLLHSLEQALVSHSQSQS